MTSRISERVPISEPHATYKTVGPIGTRENRREDLPDLGIETTKAIDWEDGSHGGSTVGGGWSGPDRPMAHQTMLRVCDEVI
jgi:hypothetical protein